MNETSLPPIDLGAEAGMAWHEYALVALAVALAMGYLARGLLRRRRGAARGCSTCPGCSSGESCPMVHLPGPGGKP